MNLSFKACFFTAKYEMLNQQHGDGDKQQKRIEARKKKKKLAWLFTCTTSVPHSTTSQNLELFEGLQMGNIFVREQI
jgi:hypothetical protein